MFVVCGVVGYLAIIENLLQSTNQSKTFARAPVTDEHWRRTSDLIKLVT